MAPDVYDKSPRRFIGESLAAQDLTRRDLTEIEVRRKIAEWAAQPMLAPPPDGYWLGATGDLSNGYVISAEGWQKLRESVERDMRETSSVATFGQGQRSEQGAFLIQRLGGAYKITYANQADIKFTYSERYGEFRDIKAEITFERGSWTAATEDTDEDAELALLDFLFYKNNGFERYGLAQPQPEEKPKRQGRAVIKEPHRNEDGDIGLA